MTTARPKETTKQKKRIREHARDWAGMAAFITALGAVAGSYSDNIASKDTQERMSKSVFNVMVQQLTLIQYRLSVVEQSCGVVVPHGFSGEMGAVHAPARMSTIAMIPPPEMSIETEAAPEPFEPLRKAKLTFEAIQRVVESGDIYEADE